MLIKMILNFFYCWQGSYVEGLKLKNYNLTFQKRNKHSLRELIDDLGVVMSDGKLHSLLILNNL